MLKIEFPPNDILVKQDCIFQNKKGAWTVNNAYSPCTFSYYSILLKAISEAAQAHAAHLCLMRVPCSPLKRQGMLPANNNMAHSKHSYSLLTHTYLTIFYDVSAAFAKKFFSHSQISIDTVKLHNHV